MLCKTGDNCVDCGYKGHQKWLKIVKTVFYIHIFALYNKMWTTREIGKLGEDIACKWLVNHGFLIVERNYLRKWGELDIIAAKDRIIHFIEVKSVSRASHHRPEENVHELKLHRLRRVIQSYLHEKRVKPEEMFQFHVLTVTMNSVTRRARINFLENIVL